MRDTYKFEDEGEHNPSDPIYTIYPFIPSLTTRQEHEILAWVDDRCLFYHSKEKAENKFEEIVKEMIESGKINDRTIATRILLNIKKKNEL